MNRSTALLGAVLLAAAAGAIRPAHAAEPSIDALTGFGDAKFGATEDEVKKVWPKMEPLGADVQKPAAAFSSPHLVRYIINGHTIDDLKSPVDVEFRFWEGKLWAFLVYFKPEDKAAVLKHLESKYGQRSSGIEDRPIWRNDKVTLQAMSDDGWYGSTDNAISELARAWFFKSLTGNPEGNAPQPAGGAAPAPEAAPKPAESGEKPAEPAAEPAAKPGS